MKYYRAVVQRDYDGDLITALICRWAVRIYAMDERYAPIDPWQFSVAGTYCFTKKGALRWARRWYRQKQRNDSIASGATSDVFLGS